MVYSDDKFLGILSDFLVLFFEGPDILKVLIHISIQRLKEILPHTSIVLNNKLTAWAACCTPSTDPHCAIFKRRLEATMPVFTAKPVLFVLGMVFGLLGWATGFLVAFTFFFGAIEIVVFKRIWWASCFICYIIVLPCHPRQWGTCQRLTSSLEYTDDNGEQFLQSKREKRDLL